MSTVVHGRIDPRLRSHTPPGVANAYGHFAPDGTEFRVTNPRPPRPWVNVIANPRLGLVVSHTGSGFTWIDNSQLAVITRWEQDFARDTSGKFVYVRDLDTGELWSLSPAPVWAALDEYTCHHGLGYTTFRTARAGIAATWTLFCHARDTVELWRVELHNTTKRRRRLALCAFLEWCCGVNPSPRREFHKLFIETEYDAARQAVFARNHMWEVPTKRWGHWNADFPYISALACTERVVAAEGDKGAFLGRYGDLRAPAALNEEQWASAFGRHEDPIAALQSVIELKPGQRHDMGYVLAVGTDRGDVERTLEQMRHTSAMDRALEDVRTGWRERLAAHRVDTPEPTLNYVTNDWIRYQAISGRLWGRCGYYQQSGAYGFRDQLQDSQVWLTIEPALCRQQINLHAAHQFADGSVYHWWHPLSEQGHVTRMTDDLLWLAFVTANYIKETGRLDVLNDQTPYLDEARPHALTDHVERAFRRVFGRTSPRGLPYIGGGDWNDGLSAMGLQERGESVWLGHFLVGLLADWAEIYRRVATQRHSDAAARGADGDGHDAPAAHARWTKLAAEFEQRRTALIAAINEHAWDGQWYMRGTLDNGSKLGSHENDVARIFLNAQTWAVLNDVAPPDRAAQCMAAVRRYLVSDAGALLLAPAFNTPNEQIGYITRYAPGLRENGGVYTHAATWAIAAACKARDPELVARLLTAINPALKNPESYWAEPYVLPGNVDGPASPHHGRAGWTWYTGAAQWLHRVVTQYVLGVRPEWDGLRIDPCLPPTWQHVRVTRPWRGSTYEIDIERAGNLPDGVDVEVILDGHKPPGNVIAASEGGATAHRVQVRVR